MKTAVKQVSRTRPLAPRDLDAVVTIDAALSGRSRRDYFERRLAAARRDPERHLQLAVDENNVLSGFMFGRALEGEFGRSEPAVRLEAFGVSPAAQGHGLASALAAAFQAEAKKRGLHEIRTTARWREHELLWFLDRMGFGLAGTCVLDCALGASPVGTAAEAPVERDAPPRDPNDYGTPGPASDFEPLARDAAEVRLLKESDLEGIARIDRRTSGRDRRGYLCRSFAETLADSALRVSLAAHADRALAGFLMARLDYGDFGRAEPAAVIDTLGVDPMRAHHGIGRALLSQLFLNLRALGVERVETAVEPGNLDLMGFFYAAGFRPAERLSFAKPLG